MQSNQMQREIEQQELDKITHLFIDGLQQFDEQEQEEGDLKQKAIIDVLDSEKHLSLLNYWDEEEKQGEKLFEKIKEKFVQTVEEQNLAKSQFLNNNQQIHFQSTNWEEGLNLSLIKRKQKKDDFDEEFQNLLNQHDLIEQQKILNECNEEKILNESNFEKCQEKKLIIQKLKQELDSHQNLIGFSDDEIWENYLEQQKMEKQQNTKQQQSQIENDQESIENYYTTSFILDQKKTYQKIQNKNEEVQQDQEDQSIPAEFLNKSFIQKQEKELENIEKKFKSEITFNEKNKIEKKQCAKQKIQEMKLDDLDQTVIYKMAIAERFIDIKSLEYIGVHHCLMILFDIDNNWIVLELGGDIGATSSQVNFYKNQEDFEKKTGKKVTYYEFELKEEFKQDHIIVKEIKEFIQPFFDKKYDIQEHNCYDYSNKIGQNYLENFQHKGRKLFNDRVVELIYNNIPTQIFKPIGGIAGEKLIGQIQNKLPSVTKAFKIFTPRVLISLKFLLPYILLIKNNISKNNGEMTNVELVNEIARIFTQIIKKISILDFVGATSFVANFSLEVAKIILPLIQKKML